MATSFRPSFASATNYSTLKGIVEEVSHLLHTLHSPQTDNQLRRQVQDALMTIQTDPGAWALCFNLLANPDDHNSTRNTSGGDGVVVVSLFAAQTLLIKINRDLGQICDLKERAQIGKSLLDLLLRSDSGAVRIKAVRDKLAQAVAVLCLLMLTPQNNNHSLDEGELLYRVCDEGMKFPESLLRILAHVPTEADRLVESVPTLIPSEVFSDQQRYYLKHFLRQFAPLTVKNILIQTLSRSSGDGIRMAFWLECCQQWIGFLDEASPDLLSPVIHLSQTINGENTRVVAIEVLIRAAALPGSLWILDHLPTPHTNNDKSEGEFEVDGVALMARLYAAYGDAHLKHIIGLDTGHVFWRGIQSLTTAIPHTAEDEEHELLIVVPVWEWWSHVSDELQTMFQLSSNDVVNVMHRMKGVFGQLLQAVLHLASYPSHYFKVTSKVGNRMRILRRELPDLLHASYSVLGREATVSILSNFTHPDDIYAWEAALWAANVLCDELIFSSVQSDSNTPSIEGLLSKAPLQTSVFTPLHRQACRFLANYPSVNNLTWLPYLASQLIVVPTEACRALEAILADHESTLLDSSHAKQTLLSEQDWTHLARLTLNLPITNASNSVNGSPRASLCKVILRGALPALASHLVHQILRGLAEQGQVNTDFSAFLECLQAVIPVIPDNFVLEPWIPQALLHLYAVKGLPQAAYCLSDLLKFHLTTDEVSPALLVQHIITNNAKNEVLRDADLHLLLACLRACSEQPSCDENLKERKDCTVYIMNWLYTHQTVIADWHLVWESLSKLPPSLLILNDSNNEQTVAIKAAQWTQLALQHLTGLSPCICRAVNKFFIGHPSSCMEPFTPQIITTCLHLLVHKQSSSSSNNTNPSSASWSNSSLKGLALPPSLQDPITRLLFECLRHAINNYPTNNNVTVMLAQALQSLHSNTPLTSTEGEGKDVINRAGKLMAVMRSYTRFRQILLEILSLQPAQLPGNKL